MSDDELKMRRTPRSFTWEYGPLVTTPVGFLLVAGATLLPSAHWLGVPLVVTCVLWCAYSCYYTCLRAQYRTRVDLPEWREALDRRLRGRGVGMRPENWGD